MVARHDGSCNTSGGFAHGSVSYCGTQCATPLSHGNKGIRYADPIFCDVARSGLHRSWIYFIQNHVRLLSRLPMPVPHLLPYFLPRMLTNPHLQRLIGTNPIASTYVAFYFFF